MKPILSRVPLYLLLLISPYSIFGQSPPSDASKRDKAEIARIEDQWLHAIETSDLATLDSILADDFVRPAPAAGRFITKSQLLDYFKSRKSKSATRHIQNLNVAIYGATAIARGNVIIADSNGGRGSTNLFTDVFVHRNGHWLAVSAQENDTISY